MNPTTSALPAPRSLVHDILPPAKQAPTVPNPVTTAIKAEVVDPIPVKNPNTNVSSNLTYEATAANPIAGAMPTLEPAHPAAKTDNDLERILKSVSRRVKATDEFERQQTKRTLFPITRLDNKQLLPIVTAVVVAVALVVVATTAMRPSLSHVRTRATANSATLSR